jgi:CheY-like chemotaxis protein
MEADGGHHALLDGPVVRPLPLAQTTRAPQPARTILIIDDEPGFVSGLARLLCHDGYAVDTAANGQLALAQLQAQRYDLVLCDLRMPGLTGPDFYDILSRQHTYLCQRVLFLTGDTVGANSTAFLEQCGQPWMYKPCNAAAIRRAMQQRLHAVEGAV